MTKVWSTKQTIDDEHTIEHRFFSSLSFKIFPSFKLLRHLSVETGHFTKFFCDLLGGSTAFSDAGGFEYMLYSSSDDGGGRERRETQRTIMHSK